MEMNIKLINLSELKKKNKLTKNKVIYQKVKKKFIK